MSSLYKNVKSGANKTAQNVGQSVGLNTGTKGEADWTDYNWPPLIRILHYSLSDVEEGARSIVRKMNISFWLTFFALIIGILSCIVQVADDAAPGINILYGFLNLVLLGAASSFTFYQGYYALATNDDDRKTKYCIYQTLLIVVYLTISIASFGAFNGWTRLGTLSDEGASSFASVLVMIEAGLYTLNYLLAAFTVFQTYKYDGVILGRPGRA